MVALKLQRFQCNPKKIFLRCLWLLVFPMLFCQSDGPGIAGGRGGPKVSKKYHVRHHLEVDNMSRTTETVRRNKYGWNRLEGHQRGHTITVNSGGGNKESTATKEGTVLCLVRPWHLLKPEAPQCGPTLPLRSPTLLLCILFVRTLLQSGLQLHQYRRMLPLCHPAPAQPHAVHCPCAIPNCPTTSRVGKYLRGFESLLCRGVEEKTEEQCPISWLDQ